MTSKKNQPGTFVHHNSLGVGKVIAQDDSGGVTVEFKSGETRPMSASVARNLTALPYNGLEAKIWYGPGEIRPWIENAPLKLLAATLTDIGGMVKAGDIKGKLQGRVFDGSVKWDPWWKRVKVAVDRSRHFKTVKNKGNAIAAIGLAARIDVDNVPAEPLPPLPPKPKPATLSDWKRWLLGETAEPPPGRWPTKAVCKTLDTWPIETVGLALARTIWGAREFLASGSTSLPAAAGWQGALVRASMRWLDCTWPDSGRNLAGQTVELLERLSRYTKGTGLSLFLVGTLSGQLDAQQSRSYEERLEQQRQEMERQHYSYEKQLAQQRVEQQRQRVSHEYELEQQRLERERQCLSYEERIENLNACHGKQLEKMRHEEDRLRQQVQTFRAQMASGREESRLEVRHGMLLAIGDILQRAHRQARSPEDRLSDVVKSLPLALHAGEAEAYGVVGETVQFNPKFHHSVAEFPSGALVRLSAPGVVFRGGHLGDRILLKANVTSQSKMS